MAFLYDGHEYTGDWREFYQKLTAAIRCFSRSMLVGRVAIIVVLACIYFGLQSYLVVCERVLGLFAPGTE